MRLLSTPVISDFAIHKSSKIHFCFRKTMNEKFRVYNVHSSHESRYHRQRFCFFPKFFELPPNLSVLLFFLYFYLKVISSPLTEFYLVRNSDIFCSNIKKWMKVFQALELESFTSFQGFSGYLPGLIGLNFNSIHLLNPIQ